MAITKADLERLERELQTEKEKTKTRAELAEITEKLAAAERQLAKDIADKAAEEAKSIPSERVLEAINTSIEQQNQQIEAAKNLIEANKEARVAIKDLGEQIKEVNRLRRLNNEELKDEIQLLVERKREADLAAEADGKAAEQFKKKVIAGRADLKLQEARLRLAQKQGDPEEEIQRLEDQIAARKKLNKTLERQSNLLNGVAEESDEASEGIKSLFSALLKGDFGGAAKAAGKVKKEFSDLKEATGSSSKAAKLLTGNLGKFALVGGGVVAAAGLAFAGFKLLGGGAAKTATDLADVSNEAAKVAGGNKELSKSLTESFKETRKFGASVEDTGKAFKSLTTDFTDFTLESDSAREKIVKQTTVLSKLGIESSATAQNMQLLTKSMGMTSEQASDTTLELAALGKDLGMDPAQLAKDFGSAGGQLAKLGSDGVAAFKRLAVASKATGLEIGKILGLIEKFDTFEGAAEQAGKLNAALGGNFVNAMELLTATDPVERFSMIRDSILDAGLAFDDMSYFQRKFFTDAAGLSDVSELAMMLSGDMDSLSGEVGKTSADYETAAARARDLAKFQEKLATTAQNLIPIVEPLVDKVNDLATGLAETTSTGNGAAAVLGVIGVAFVALAGLIFAFGGPAIAIFGAIASAVAALGAAIFTTSFNPPSFFKGIKEMSTDFDGMSVNINKSSKTMHSFGNEVVATGNKTFRQTQMTKKAMPQVMQMTNTSMTNEIKKNQINNAMLGSSTATTNAMTNAVRNSTNNTTINNNGQGGGDTGISIKFDNKKFADLFDVQVEKSIGRTARKAVI